MKRIIANLLLAGCMITLVLSVYFSYQVSKGTYNGLFNEHVIEDDMYRIVYITQELGTPFWDNVQVGAELVAEENDVVIDFWGSYRPNQNELLKHMDIAIASKVNGIIVQGTENEAFVNVVNKASAKGIPVITIATDAPESLRKTYVGSDHFNEGLIIGKRVAAVLNGSGKVAIIEGSDPSSYQKMRQQGVAVVLSQYPDVEIVKMDPSEALRYAERETNDLINLHPDCKVFLGLSAEANAGIIHAIKTRYKLSDYTIFSFDDSNETIDFVKQGLIKATLSHSPQDMGEKSMSLMLRWLEGKDIPLERNYYTVSNVITSEALP